MGRFSPHHPPEVVQAVGNAIADGIGPTEACRRLKHGQLKGHHGPYELPIETARHYGRRERQRRRSKQLSEKAKTDPGGLVDYLARSLLTETEAAVEQLRASGKKDPETLKKWAEVLTKLNPLVRPEPTSTERKAKTPTDPLAKRLTAGLQPVPEPSLNDNVEGDTTDTSKRRDSTASNTNPNTPPARLQPAGVQALNGGGAWEAGMPDRAGSS